MAHSAIRQTIYFIRSNKVFSVIVDEATDYSFKEQVSIRFRHVDTNALEVHEELSSEKVFQTHLAQEFSCSQSTILCQKDEIRRDVADNKVKDHKQKRE